MDKKKIRKENAHHVGLQFGNELSKNVQEGTKKTIEGMNLFRVKGDSLSNVGYEQAKGNLFEYIEAAKLQKNMANAGATPFDKFPATDVPAKMGGYGEHTAPDDFKFQKNGKIIGKGQAKINNDPHKTAVNFTNPKYSGMQRNTTADSVESVKKHLDDMLAKGEVSKSSYNDAINNLEGMLTDPESGITSGGTTTDELKQFKGSDGKISKAAVKKYAKKFELKQYGRDIAVTSANMAILSAISTGIISGVENCFAVLQNRKKLDEAIKDVGVEVVKSGTKGGITGAISSLLRIGGTKGKIPILSDSSSSLVIAAGVVDSGVAIYEYARGEIDSEQLVEQIKDTAIKSTATIFFTKATAAVFGAANPFIPIAIYSVANYVVAATREIIRNAKLKAAEYERLTELNNEATELVKEFHHKLLEQMNNYEQNQKRQMLHFLNAFDDSVLSGNNYDASIYAIINFANATGIALQHADFNDFSNAMMSSESFVLGKK